jgi:hypothetical protein
MNPATPLCKHLSAASNAAWFSTGPRTRVHALWQILRSLLLPAEKPIENHSQLFFWRFATQSCLRRDQLVAHGCPDAAGTGRVKPLFVGKHSYNLALAIWTRDRIGAGHSWNHAGPAARGCVQDSLMADVDVAVPRGLTVFLGSVRWTDYRISVIKLKSANETSVFRHVGRASIPRRISSADQGAS